MRSTGAGRFITAPVTFTNAEAMGVERWQTLTVRREGVGS
jgi:hypothetical protein